MKQLLLSIIVAFILGSPVQSSSQPRDEKEEVLKVARLFFEALEKQDTVIFNKILMKDSYNYMVIEQGESAQLVSRLHKHSNFKSDRVIKERMRESEVVVQIHKRIATVWAPYDLWVNDQYSHCGVDAFIMLKGNDGWKIGTISFSIEKEGCK
jgi:hypothetical protein